MDSAKKILVVEDEEVVVNSAKKILSLEKLEIDSVIEVEDAIKQLEKNKDQYSIIITDLMLPKVSGMELVKTVTKEYPSLPIIVFTGYATTEKAIEAIASGAFDFLPKPFSIEELLGVVGRCLNYITAKDAKGYQENVEKQYDIKNAAGENYCFGEHSWVRIDSKESATIGVGKTFFHLIDNIKEIEFSNLNEEINQGNSCAKITMDNESIHVVRMPISGMVTEFNLELDTNNQLLNTEPFSNGWLIKVTPTGLEKDLRMLQKK